MTPRRFSAASVQRRLDAIDDLLGELAAELPTDGAGLAADVRSRRVIERLLTLLADNVVKINTHVVATSGARPPDDYRGSLPAAARAGLISDDLAARLEPAISQRNILVHEYERIDLELLATGAQNAARDYREYVRQVATFLMTGGPRDS